MSWQGEIYPFSRDWKKAFSDGSLLTWMMNQHTSTQGKWLPCSFSAFIRRLKLPVLHTAWLAPAISTELPSSMQRGPALGRLHLTLRCVIFALPLHLEHEERTTSYGFCVLILSSTARLRNPRSLRPRFKKSSTHMRTKEALRKSKAKVSTSMVNDM